jgi:low temperature requirement protein LtrA
VLRHFLADKKLLGGLIKAPVVRQFICDGKLFREEDDRSQSHFELFADLVFVGIVHVLGEVAAEEATAFNAGKFWLLFWPPWTVYVVIFLSAHFDLTLTSNLSKLE